MMQIQAAQAGTPLKERKAKMNLLDVYNDPVGDTIRDRPQDLTFDECLRHQASAQPMSIPPRAQPMPTMPSRCGAPLMPSASLLRPSLTCNERPAPRR